MQQSCAISQHKSWKQNMINYDKNSSWLWTKRVLKNIQKYENVHKDMWIISSCYMILYVRKWKLRKRTIIQVVNFEDQITNLKSKRHKETTLTTLDDVG